MRQGSILLLLFIFSSHFSLSEEQSPSLKQTCKINEKCLEHLNHVLLDKTNNRGIYQYCKMTYEAMKSCCVDPSACQENYGRDKAQSLREDSLSYIPESGAEALSCELNRLSQLTNSLSAVQSQMCSLGVENCQMDCEDKLVEVKQAFRDCFSVPNNYSIEEILKKAESPPSAEEACYRKMKEVANKYKSQSLSNFSELREDLEAKDIVRCEDIYKAKTQQAFRAFAMNICQKAQIQKQEEAEQAKQALEQEKRQAETAQQMKAQSLGNTAQGSVQPQSQGTTQPKASSSSGNKKTQSKKSGLSGGQALIGAGAVAGVIAGAKALQNGNNSNKERVRKQKAPRLEPVVSKTKTSKKSEVTQKTKTQVKKTTLTKTHSAKQLNISSKNKSQEDQKNTDLKQCPIAFSNVKPVVVYQSIEAPQIEPLHTLKDHFNNYDLVEGKPALVLLNIKQIAEIKDKPQYIITLKDHSRNPAIKINTRCSKNLRKTDFELDPKKDPKKDSDETGFRPDDSECDFRGSEFKKIRNKIQQNYSSRVGEEGIMNLYKFVELPIIKLKMRDADRRLPIKRIRFSVLIESKKDKTCSFKKDFFVFFRRTKKLHIDFMTLKYFDNHIGSSLCKKNEISKLSVLQDFAESEELTEFIPLSYPIAEDRFSAGFIMDRQIPALCNNSSPSGSHVSQGVLFDIARAEEDIYFNQRDYADHFVKYSKEKDLLLSNRKIMIVVSKNYMKYHGRSDSLGFMVKPRRKDLSVIGSWNTAFIREDQYNDGTVAHELAHLLGQYKEYYPKIYKTGLNKDKPLPPDQQKYWCRKFSEKSIPCHKYKIFGGIEAGLNLKKLRFLINKFPFMNNETSRIPEQWIERDTFQRLFRTLHSNKLDPEHSWKQKRIKPNLPQKKVVPSISLLGIYDKEKGKFYKNISIIYEKGLHTASGQKGDIEVLLTKRIKKGDSIRHRVLSKTTVETDLVMEFLSEKGGRTVKLKQIPVIARLPIPENYFKDEKVRKSLNLIVRETFFTIRPAHYATNKKHFNKKGLKSEKPEENSVSKKRKILYNAPIDWSNKAEDFFMRGKQ